MKRFAMLLLLSLLALAVSGPADSQDRGDGDLLDELEKILEAEKKKSNHDRDLVRRLERLVRKHRGSGGSGGNEEDSSGGGRSGRSGGGRGWDTESLVERLLGDVVLDGDELEKVRRILTDFLTSRKLIQDNRHLECYDDIKRDRNNRLAKAVGQRKAREIIENADKQVDRWDRWSRWGNRGGGGR